MKWQELQGMVWLTRFLQENLHPLGLRPKYIINFLPMHVGITQFVIKEATGILTLWGYLFYSKNRGRSRSYNCVDLLSEEGKLSLRVKRRRFRGISDGSEIIMFTWLRGVRVTLLMRLIWTECCKSLSRFFLDFPIFLEVGVRITGFGN